MTRGDLTITADGSGTLVPGDERELAFAAGGVLTELLVSVGDEVQAGDPVARVDDADTQQALVSAQVQLLKAQLDIASAETHLLTVQEGSSNADLLAAEASLASAQEALASLLNGPEESQIEKLQLSLAQAKNSLWSAQLSRDAAGGGPDAAKYESAQVSVANAEISVRKAEIADQINALGPNLIMVMPSFSQGGFGAGAGARMGLAYDDIEAISQNVTGINGVAAEQTTNQTLKAGNTTLDSITVVGTTSGLPAVRDYAVAEGRFVTDEDDERGNKVVVLGAGVAEELVGEANPIGQSVKIGSSRFTVVGVMETKGVVGNTDYDGRVYIPLTVYFDRFSNERFGGDTVRLVYVSAESRSVMDDVMSQLTTLLSQRHGVDPMMPDFQLMTQDTIIDTASSTTETFRDLLAWVAAVSLVVGGIGIMNIMLVSVTERTREIGLRQALGARPRDVQLQFLLEAVTLSLIGGLLGVLAGVGGCYLSNALGSMRTELVPASIPLAFLAAAAVGIFFGYYPATRAAQLDPIVALRRE